MVHGTVYRSLTKLLTIKCVVPQQMTRNLSVTPIVFCSYTLKHSVNAKVNKTLLDKYMNLPQPKDRIIAKYIWIDGTGEHVRAKSRTLNFVPQVVEELPKWNYDGSSTYQATGSNSDTFLHPVAMYKDPFRRGNNILVLCDTYQHDKQPSKSNHRNACKEAHDIIKDQEPWWGIEQEYTLLDVDHRPFGWPPMGFPAPQGPYYCGVGADKVYGREIVEAHYRACLYAGIDIAGTNVEVMPSQLEYQIGPTLGIKAADDHWMSRFILHRIAEEYGIVVTFDPKPMTGAWNGAGAHTNFSTNDMRKDGGIKAIEAAIQKLSKRHAEHIKVYDPRGGEDNVRRLVGRLETSSIDKFSFGIADRGVSVRIPRSVAEDKKGWLEDRRPSSNMDPYAVCNAILRTTLIDKI